MNLLQVESFERIRDAVKNVYGLANLDEWITRNTFMNGKPFSYKDHEFQIPILRDTARTSLIVKCAQIGLSELAYRWAVAACCTIEDFTIIYTFPSSSDAEKNNRTRIDPMIEDSPVVKRLVNPDMNNSEMKQFGKMSFLHFKGTRSATQALSTPANAVIHDEYDKSDITQASVYVSRLQHKPHRIRKIFSTPTIDGYGISKEAETARRLKHLAKCNHCNHWFLPDYFTDIKIPGWTKDLTEITKQNLHTVRWKEAVLLCPNCGQDPQLHHTRMEFVCENNQENHEANAWYVSPFSAHNVLKTSYLVQASTQYERFSEFKNQTLGLTAMEENEAITQDDVDKAQAWPNLESSEFHVMGSDMGLICHICIGRMGQDGTMIVVHREKVHYMQFETRTRELSAKYRVMLHVMDSQPYTELVTRICQARPHSWGAIFVSTKNTLAFTLQEQEKEVTEGKMEMRLVKINRTVALDAVLRLFKNGTIAIQASDENADFAVQMQSCRRTEVFTKDGELTYVWQKTGDKNDHYHMALMYLYLAIQMRGTVGGLGAAGSGMALVRRFTPKH